MLKRILLVTLLSSPFALSGLAMGQEGSAPTPEKPAKKTVKRAKRSRKSKKEKKGSEGQGSPTP